MNKKKKIVIIIICVVCIGLILIPYINYRISVDWVCEESERIVNSLNNEEHITINKKEYQGDYLEYENIKIANEFAEFSVSELSVSNLYTLNDTASFLIGTKESEIEILKKFETYELYEPYELYFIDSEKIIEQFIEENNLKNNIDLFNYIKTNEFNGNELFTSSKKRKTDYIVGNVIIASMPQFSKIIYINGDYNGYIYELENGYQVELEKNDKYYIFIFNNLSGENYYTKEKVYDLISTVIIE